MGKKGTYETNEKAQFTCGYMMMSVLDPIDDPMITHRLTVSYNKGMDLHAWFQIGY